MIDLLSPIKEKHRALDEEFIHHKRLEAMETINASTSALKVELRVLSDICDYELGKYNFGGVSTENYSSMYITALTGNSEGLISGIGSIIAYIYKKIVILITKILSWFKTKLSKLFGSSITAKQRVVGIYEEYQEIYKVLTPADRDTAKDKFLTKPILYMPKFSDFKNICHAYMFCVDQLVKNVELLTNTEIAEAPTEDIQKSGYDYFNWMTDALINNLSTLGIKIENNTTLTYKSPFEDLPKSTLGELGYNSFDSLDEMNKLYTDEVFGKLKFAKELQAKLEHKKSTLKHSTYSDTDPDKANKQQANNLLRITTQNLTTIVTLTRHFSSLNDTIQHRWYLACIAAKRAVLTVKNKEAINEE